MSDTLDPSLNGLNDCGCCAGITAETPMALLNREGLNQINYRVGTHGPFKRTMLAALSEARHPKLRGLTTRADDDFSIALLDAWATTADVLTFYQERLANESYLRTATEQGSVLRLARLIGYELKPGVAASTWLAFTLETAPGSPEKAAIAAGAKVQSVPGQDEKPQVFETVQPLEARVEWNAMRPQVVEESPILRGAKTSENIREMYLKGSATQLQVGDAILILGDEREKNPKVHPQKERWDVRILTRVTVNADKDWTRVEWEHGLGKGAVEPAERNVRAYAFRQRAALFGHNAPDPSLIIKPGGSAVGSWTNFTIRNGVIELDVSHAKIVPGSWLALSRPPDGTYPRGYVELYRALKVSFPSRAEFALTGKVTRIEPDTAEHLDKDFFKLRDTIVHAQSEQLEIVSPPLTRRADEALSRSIELDEGTLAPVEGLRVTLDRQVTELPKSRIIIVTGKRFRARLALDARVMALTGNAGSKSKPLRLGDTLVVMRPPAVQSNGVTWGLRDDDGFEGTLETGLNDLRLTTARKDDDTVSEAVTVESAAGNPTELLLGGKGLQNIYDRATVVIYGNVAQATHGEMVQEIAGSGDGTQTFQRFTLRQSPLTYLRSNSSFGPASTLEVRVDDLLWRKVPSLYQQKPDERIYLERLGDEQKTTVHFGDGITGARLPTGQQNVRFKCRKGSGLEGLVKAGQLTQLLTRPPGVKEVNNPLPAEGADEPESLSDARQNAPLTVLTLERVVSLQDYEDFARGYPGIAKALATWTWNGRTRGVLLTVAGPEGVSVETGVGSVGSGLLNSLRASGDPFVPMRVETFRPAFFRVTGTVTVHPDYEKEKVLAAARQALRSRFSFAAREFGQPVMLSVAIGVLHSVAGVTAVDIDHLQRTDRTEPVDPAPRLLAEFPAGGASLATKAAELLLLAAGNLEEVKVA